jgi:hypothetical protein
MLRRLLLTAFLATLAVALPAAAEEDPSAFGIPIGSDAQDCLTPDLACLGEADGSSAASEAESGEGFACRAWDLNMPDNNQPLMDTLILDPDGCVRSFIRRTLGWPPIEWTFEVYSSTLPEFAILT